MHSKPPNVDLGAILINKNEVKFNHINNYNENTCKLETVPLKIIPLLLEDGTVNPELNGAVLVSYKDFIRIQDWGKTECEYYKKRKAQEELNAKTNQCN